MFNVIIVLFSICSIIKGIYIIYTNKTSITKYSNYFIINDIDKFNKVIGSTYIFFGITFICLNIGVFLNNKPILYFTLFIMLVIPLVIWYFFLSCVSRHK